MPLSRRDFLAASAALPLTAPAVHALGANEKLNVGLIGCGGRCRHLVQALVKVPHVRIAAVCDVFTPNLQAGRSWADKQAFATGAYRAVPDRKDVDAVLSATPDHWHVPSTGRA